MYGFWRYYLAFPDSSFSGGDPVPGSAAKIRVTERQLRILQDIAHSRTAAVRLVQRATLILRALDRIDNQDIADDIDLNRNAIGLWRRRWAEAWPKLISVECTETQADLRRAIEDVLSDEPRPGNPGKFTPEQVTQILALACEPPEKSAARSPTGPLTSWPTRPRSGASLRRSRRRRSIAISTRRNCNRIAVVIGSTPRRKTRGNSRRKSKRCAIVITKHRGCTRRSTRTRFARMR